MKNTIVIIKIEQLQPNPDNPNKMSKSNFLKLVRNIERTGLYEPLIVRPFQESYYQIINGHQRFEALKKLGYENCDCIVWNVDDNKTDLLLATLNNLRGSDVLDKKLALLKKLSAKSSPAELSKLLPYTKPQIARMTELESSTLPEIRNQESNTEPMAVPMVFFLTPEQKKSVEKALSGVSLSKTNLTKAELNAQALANIASEFVESKHRDTKTPRNESINTI